MSKYLIVIPWEGETVFQKKGTKGSGVTCKYYSYITEPLEGLKIWLGWGEQVKQITFPVFNNNNHLTQKMSHLDTKCKQKNMKLMNLVSHLSNFLLNQILWICSSPRHFKDDKGQKISKAIHGVLNSSKKQMKNYYSDHILFKKYSG